MHDRFVGPFFVGAYLLEFEIVSARQVVLWIECSRWHVPIGEA